MRKEICDMQKIKISKSAGIQLFLVAVAAVLLFLAAFSRQISLGQSFLQVVVDGEVVGAVAADTDVEQVFLQARRALALEQSDRLFLAFDWSCKTERAVFTPLMTKPELFEAIKTVLRGKQPGGRVQAYTVAVEDFRATFATLDEVKVFLERVKQPSDEEDAYGVCFRGEDLLIDGIMEASLERRGAPEEQKEAENDGHFAGVAAWHGQMLGSPGGGEAYQTGLLDLSFVEQVSVYRSYVDPDGLSDLTNALTEVTKQKESNKIYVVESGDCLSVIALDYGTTVSELVKLNHMEDADTLREGQELIIAVPEPDLKLRLVMGEVYEEDYEKTPVIVKNDNWYTTKEVVLQEGSTGHRERNDVVVYENGFEVSRNLAQQTVMVESVAAVIERGTIKPPTYIKPLNGGRFSSGYGYRWGRLHKGVDYACSIGTTVFASSAGTVVQAGYNSGGYGNNVVISHPDGRMTRYAHNSKILVHVGQHVEQGEPIALSGNTGRSTGPHLHFEIYINGSPVNPLKYIQ